MIITIQLKNVGSLEIHSIKRFILDVNNSLLYFCKDILKNFNFKILVNADV